jgi:hypothetical protein
MDHYEARPVTERSFRLSYYIRTDVMKFPRLLLVLIATTAGAFDAQVVSGQSDPSASGVTVSGAIISSGSGNPVPFSTVRLQPLGRERFTDRD